MPGLELGYQAKAGYRKSSTWNRENARISHGSLDALFPDVVRTHNFTIFMCESKCHLGGLRQNQNEAGPLSKEHFYLKG